MYKHIDTQNSSMQEIRHCGPVDALHVKARYTQANHGRASATTCHGFVLVARVSKTSTHLDEMALNVVSFASHIHKS